MVFSMWWIYFKRPMVDSLSRETAFVFGYVHDFVFASIAPSGPASPCWSTSSRARPTSALADRPCCCSSGRSSIYLLVISGLHSLADRALRDAMPALIVRSR